MMNIIPSYHPLMEESSSRRAVWLKYTVARVVVVAISWFVLEIISVLIRILKNAHNCFFFLSFFNFSKELPLSESPTPKCILKISKCRFGQWQDLEMAHACGCSNITCCWYEWHHGVSGTRLLPSPFRRHSEWRILGFSRTQ